MAMSADDLQNFMDFIDSHRPYTKSSNGQVLLVSDLPTLDASWVGAMAVVSNALLPLWHVAVVGGGGVETPVMWTGTQWVAI